MYYSLESPTDGGAVWTEKTWDDHHVTSNFKLPKVHSDILREKSRELFQKFVKLYPQGGISNWVRKNSME